MTCWQVTAVTPSGGVMLFGVVTPTPNGDDARDAAREMLGGLPAVRVTVTVLPAPVQRPGWDDRYADE
jgi:hypothetical protein